jgi:hypothetical protein
MNEPRKERVETWEYTIGPDGSLHFNRRTEFWVMHELYWVADVDWIIEAGCLTRQYCQLRAALGVWVLSMGGKLWVVENNL